MIRVSKNDQIRMLREMLTEHEAKDRQRTLEHNILVKENREQAEQLDMLRRELDHRNERLRQFTGIALELEEERRRRSRDFINNANTYQKLQTRYDDLADNVRRTVERGLKLAQSVQAYPKVCHCSTLTNSLTDVCQHILDLTEYK